jgi:hypothetical protein
VTREFLARPDIKALAQEMGSWNKLIAAFGGKFKDLWAMVHWGCGQPSPNARPVRRYQRHQPSEARRHGIQPGCTSCGDSPKTGAALVTRSAWLPRNRCRYAILHGIQVSSSKG